jgi:hypothetical protein
LPAELHYYPFSRAARCAGSDRDFDELDAAATLALIILTISDLIPAFLFFTFFVALGLLYSLLCDSTFYFGTNEIKSNERRPVELSAAATFLFRLHALSHLSGPCRHIPALQSAGVRIISVAIFKKDPLLRS